MQNLSLYSIVQQMHPDWLTGTHALNAVRSAQTARMVTLRIKLSGFALTVGTLGMDLPQAIKNHADLLQALTLELFLKCQYQIAAFGRKWNCLLTSGVQVRVLTTLCLVERQDSALRTYSST